MTTHKHRIAGINFDHMHMGDLLRMAHEHPNAEIVGICDETPSRMEGAVKNFAIPADRVFTDYRKCLETTKPDLVILCPATAKHAEWTEKVAPFGTHIFMEKPFAATLAEADRMIAALIKTGKQLIINWPLRWYPSHITAKRLVDEGAIGELIQVHYYDGNRGPMRHVADKIEISEEQANREKSKSWFYRKADGGGSLLDYLGYGTTLGTWYMNGRKPIEVTSTVDQPRRRGGGVLKSTSTPSPSPATPPASPSSKPAGAPSPIPGSCNPSPNAASSSLVARARSVPTTTKKPSASKPATARRAKTSPRRPHRGPQRQSHPVRAPLPRHQPPRRWPPLPRHRPRRPANRRRRRP